MGPVKEDKTVVLSLKLKALEDQMDKAVKSCESDSALYRNQAAIYNAARHVLETVETLEEAGLEHSDAMTIAQLLEMRFRR